MTLTSIPPAKAAHLRKIQPGDLLDVVAQLRRYMSVADTAAYTLYASFEGINPEVQDLAEKARRNVEATAARLFQLLSAIEKHPIYLAARQRHEVDASMTDEDNDDQADDNE